jgi:tetratricopeptide (TPR) repeat protein
LNLVPNTQLKHLIETCGWTPAEVAEAINASYANVTGSNPGLYDEKSVRRLISGQVTWPTKPYRTAFMQVFKVDSPRELGFYRRSSRRPDGEDDVRRIDFLRGLAAVGGGSLLTGGLTATLDDAVVRTPIPTSVGPDEIDGIRKLTLAVRAADHGGHPWAMEAMAAQVRRGVELVDACTDTPVRHDLQTAVGVLADAVGWAHFDLGKHRAADRYFRVALHYADEAAAFWLRADVLSSMARQAVWLGQIALDEDTAQKHFDDALTLVGAAKVREDRISQLRRANLSAVLARAHSSLGNVRECVRAVRDADEFFHDASDARDELDYYDYSRYFTYAQLNGDTGTALWDIAIRGFEVKEARHRLEIAAEQYGPEWARSQALCLARTSILLLRSGEPDEGAAVGQSAVSAAKTIGSSSRLAFDLRGIHDAAVIDIPEVKALRSSAAEVITV